MIIDYIKKLIRNLFYTKNTIVVDNLDIQLQQLQQENYICEINFKLTEKQDIDIEFVHARVQESSVEDISSLAEICANLIVLLNNGLLKKQLLNTIKSHKKHNMNNDKNTLFLDNVLFFNNLLQDELKHIKRENSPLIRPSSVFRSLN
jgi:hypothetical protein